MEEENKEPPKEAEGEGNIKLITNDNSRNDIDLKSKPDEKIISYSYQSTIDEPIWQTLVCIFNNKFTAFITTYIRQGI